MESFFDFINANTSRLVNLINNHYNFSPLEQFEIPENFGKGYGTYYYLPNDVLCFYSKILNFFRISALGEVAFYTSSVFCFFMIMLRFHLRFFPDT